MQIAKKHDAHAFSQFTFTQNLINNLQQFDLTPTAKLVLIYLSTCYNPKHAEIFPKQSTIAEKLGLSEASVIRAISEAHKQGLIISERKYTNRYKITPRFLNLCGMDEQTNKRQEKNNQIESKETCNLQPPLIEPTIQPKNEPLKVEDFKILKEYAQKHNAKNINAYINVLIKNGSADKIIKEAKAIKRQRDYFEKRSKETFEHINKINATQTDITPEMMLQFRAKIKALN